MTRSLELIEPVLDPVMGEGGDDFLDLTHVEFPPSRPSRSPSCFEIRFVSRARGASSL